MSKWPKITVITPSYNQGEYIEKTIKSVIEQNYPRLEYIIIDGKSTDNSCSIIKKYQKHIDYWVSEKDNGQSHAINKGLKQATGDIINWINSDDYYSPGALHSIAKGFMENKNAKVISGKIKNFTNERELGFGKPTTIYGNNIYKSIGWAHIAQPATFFHRTAVKKMGFLNETLNYVMDKEWWIKYLLHFGLNNIYEIPDTLVHFRYHSTSKSVSESDRFNIERNSIFFSLASILNLKKEKRLIASVSEINNKITFEQNNQFNKISLKRSIHYFILLLGCEFYYKNEKQQAIKCFEAINPSCLFLKDQKKLKKLSFRAKYIPCWLLNLARKSRSG